ncbi:MAG: ParB/RepB/Spo0J family partition protein [Alphaproteobacteria bacterium]|nr:ParB/RepB/Spo0J family partition protein [Alphaproteobacteria bacterium]
MSSNRVARGLGRGLASLIPDSALEMDALPAEREALRVVPIDEIKPNPEQPREVFDKALLDDLTASIKAHGVLSPLVVRREEGRYIVIAGERRLRAAALAGLTNVPVLVREAEERSTQLELALVENLQRADLDPIESARGFQRLVDEYGYTQDQVAAAVGKDRSTIANLVRLLKLPEFVLGALRDGRISAGHARAMLPLATGTDDDDAGHAELRRVLARVLAQTLNVRQTERLVASIVRAPTAAVTTQSGKVRQERTLQYAVKLIEESLHTSVEIRPKTKGGGRIVLDYSDAEDLERIIGLLRGSRS